MKTFFLLVGKSLLYAAGMIFLVIPLFSVGSGSNLGPFGALLGAIVYFPIFTVFFLIVETLLTFNKKLDRKKTYIFLLITGLFAVVLYIGINHREFTRSGRMEHATPLTESERELLESTRLNIRVAVADPNEKPAYVRSLIHDLWATCLFADVKEFNGIETTDVLATIIGRFWGDKVGQSFVFHLPERSSEGVEIRVFYKLGPALPWIGRKSVHRQYLDRLSVELIKASQTLFAEGQQSLSGPIFVAPDQNRDCKRN